MLILFSFLGKNFFGLKNFTIIVMGVSSLLLLASGETFVIVSGGIDLSIGFVMGFVCVSSAIVMRDLHAAGYSQATSILVGSLIGLFLGLIPGFINGLLIAMLRVPPFIATLGMWGVANGLAWRLCEGFPVAFLPPQVREIGMAYLAYFSSKKGFLLFQKPVLTERPDILCSSSRLSCLSLPLFCLGPGLASTPMPSEARWTLPFVPASTYPGI
jgi:ribose transport system permease protein